MPTLQEVYGSARSLSAEERKMLAELLLAEIEIDHAGNHPPPDTDSLRWLATHGEPPAPSEGAWRQTVGMFSNDSLIEEINSAGERLRAADRERR